MSIARLSNPDRASCPRVLQKTSPTSGKDGQGSGRNGNSSRRQGAQRRTTLATGNVRGLEEIGTEEFKPGWVSRTFQDARCLTPFGSVGENFDGPPVRLQSSQR